MKISLKAAKALYIYSPEGGPLTELKAAIARATRASTTRRQLRAPKVAKRKAKREATSAVWAAVMERADDTCECGCGGWFTNSLQGARTMDHFEGKARSESLETCWALRAGCHQNKTDNKPSAAWWLERFASHAEQHGYTDAAQRALCRLSVIEATRGAQ